MTIGVLNGSTRLLPHVAHQLACMSAGAFVFDGGRVGGVTVDVAIPPMTRSCRTTFGCGPIAMKPMKVASSRKLIPVMTAIVADSTHFPVVGSGGLCGLLRSSLAIGRRWLHNRRQIGMDCSAVARLCMLHNSRYGAQLGSQPYGLHVRCCEAFHIPCQALTGTGWRTGGARNGVSRSVLEPH